MSDCLYVTSALMSSSTNTICTAADRDTYAVSELMDAVRVAVWAQSDCPEYAGATVIASTAPATSSARTAFNITVTTEGALQSTGVLGIRADFYNSATKTYPQAHSYFFYPKASAKVSQLGLLLPWWQYNDCGTVPELVVPDS